MKKLFVLFLLAMFSTVHGSLSESEFLGQIEVVKGYAFLRYSEPSEKEHELKEAAELPPSVGEALWAIQKDIERSIPKDTSHVPLIEREIFTTVLSKITMLMALGDAIASEPFWEKVFSFYHNTFFDTPNFWQERVRLWGRGEGQTWRDAVLGHLFFPEHYLAITVINAEFNGLFSLLSGASAHYKDFEGSYWYFQYGRKFDLDAPDFDWRKVNKEHQGVAFVWALDNAMSDRKTVSVLEDICKTGTYTRGLVCYGTAVFFHVKDRHEEAKSLSLTAFERGALSAAFVLRRYYRTQKNLLEEKKYERIIRDYDDDLTSSGEDERWMARQVFTLFGVPYEGISGVKRILS